MSKKVHASKNFLENLVKETLEDPNQSQESLEVEPEISDSAEEDVGIPESEIDAEIEEFIRNLISGNEDAAKFALNKLMSTGSLLDDIYYAIADFLATGSESENVSELQNMQEQAGATPINKAAAGANLLAYAAKLSKLGLEDESRLVLKFAEEVMNEPEADAALEIFHKANPQIKDFHLNKPKITQDLGLTQKPLQAGAGAGLANVIRLLPKVFKWARDVFRRSRTTKRGSRRVKRRATKFKNRKRRRTRGFNRKPKKPSKWRKIKKGLQVSAAAAAIYNYEGTIKVFKSMLLELKANALQFEVWGLYNNNKIQYALENFDGEGTNTEEYKKIKHYFSLFSNHDLDYVDCLPAEISFSKRTKNSCDNITLMPAAYNLDTKLENSLKLNSNSPESILRSLNKDQGSASDSNRLPFTRDKTSAEKYVEVYKKYKDIFKKTSTGKIVDDVIFINEKNAITAARAAVQGKVSISVFIKFCIKPLLLWELDLEEQENKDISSVDFWSKLYKEKEKEETINILTEILEYKQLFIFEYFGTNDVSEEPDATAIAVRNNFAAFSAAHQTSMINKRGGYQAIINCMKAPEGGGSPFDKDKQYSLQSGKIRTLVALLAGGVMDQKLVEATGLLLSKIKKKALPGPEPDDILKGPWGTFFKFIPLAEIGFYIFDPMNIYDRKFVIEPALDNIKILIDKEAEFFEHRQQKTWVMRSVTLAKIEKEMDFIFNEIESEMSKSIDRFYDIAYDEESLCQQLRDKIEIRRESWRQCLKFKNEVYKAMLKRKGGNSSNSSKINKFYITSENWLYVSESVKVIKKEMIELHKAIAQPETGLFFSGTPMDTPEEFAGKIREPAIPSPEKKEKEKRSPQRGTGAGGSRGSIRWESMSGRERNTFVSAVVDKVLLREADGQPFRSGENKKEALVVANPWIITMNIDDAAAPMKLVDSLLTYPVSGVPTWSPNMKNFVKAAMTAFKTSDVTPSGKNRLSSRIKNIKPFMARAPIGNPGDKISSPFSSGAMAEPVSGIQNIAFAQDDAATREDLELLIKEGYDNFNKIFPGESRINKFTRTKQAGCLIKIETTGNPGGGLWGTDMNTNDFGNLIFADISAGVSLRKKDMITIPYINFFSTSKNDISIAYEYKNNMKELEKLLSRKISPTREYRVIYDPIGVDVRTAKKSGQKAASDWMLNTSLSRPADSQPVVDIMVDTLVLPAISEHSTRLHPKRFGYTQLQEGEIKMLKELSSKCKARAIFTLRKFDSVDFNTGLGLKIAKDFEFNGAAAAEQWRQNNIMTAEIVYAACQAFDAVMRCYAAFDMVIYNHIKFWWKKLINKYDSGRAELKTIQRSIYEIEKLFFVRPVGDYISSDASDKVQSDSRQDGAGVPIVRPSSDPKVIKRVDTNRAKRWMGKTGVKSIIEKNMEIYKEIISNIERLNKDQRLITGNIKTDTDTIGPLVASILSGVKLNNTLAENSFSFSKFISSVSSGDAK